MHSNGQRVSAFLPLFSPHFSGNKKTPLSYGKYIIVGSSFPNTKSFRRKKSEKNFVFPKVSAEKTISIRNFIFLRIKKYACPRDRQSYAIFCRVSETNAFRHRMIRHCCCCNAFAQDPKGYSHRCRPCKSPPFFVLTNSPYFSICVPKKSVKPNFQMMTNFFLSSFFCHYFGKIWYKKTENFCFAKNFRFLFKTVSRNFQTLYIVPSKSNRPYLLDHFFVWL